MYANTHPPASNCGRIIRHTRSSYLIRSGNDCIEGTLSTRLKNESGSNPVVVGDMVVWNEAAQITEVLPRHNWLSRRSAVPMPSSYAQEQVLVANVDQVVPVLAAANPRLAWNLLDRFLVSSEASDIPALIVLTKLDLVAGRHLQEIEAIAEEYRAIGYAVVLTSTVTGRGLDELKACLQGRLSVLLGKSGVGKTSLLNAIEPGLGQRVQATSKATGKGRHTTTTIEIFALALGGALVDTPGMREFGLWDVDGRDLAWFFPEMRPFLGRCKFGASCRHDQEPGCTIRKAVVDGLISPYRYQSYLKLRAEE